jgi:glycosyltransferase involved in cell wall biosynthesis
MPMKVLWLSHLVPYPPKGGVLQRSYNLVRELARHHEVSLLAFVQGEPLRASFGQLEQGLAEAEAALSGFCARVTFVPIPCEQRALGRHRLALRSLLSRDPYTINWLKSGPYAHEVRRLIGEVNPDLVHFDTISLAHYRPLVGALPTVLDHHNIESHMMLRRAEKEANGLAAAYFRQEGRRLARYEQEACPKFTLNITCSSLDSARLKDLVPTAAVDDVPNGVDVGYFHPAGEVEVPGSLIFAGTLSWYPNRQAVDFIAKEIWPRLREQVPGSSVDIVGASPPAELVDLGRRDPAFRVHGFVDDVRPYLDRAAVYVCPITDGGGTKLKILDALAMGKAIVADPIACEGIDVTDGVDVVFASTPEDYVTAIERLLADPALRKRLGQNARLLAESKYAYSIIGEKLARLVREAVETARSVASGPS